jgi:iron complex outermembrane recepter protein
MEDFPVSMVVLNVRPPCEHGNEQALMVGRRGSTSIAWMIGRLLLALAVAVCTAGTATAGAAKYYDINLPRQSVATALNGLSEQTNVPVVFPYDLAKDRTSNPVIGRYTLLEALNALLKGTGLSGGLSEKGVLTISPAASTTTQGEMAVPNIGIPDLKPTESNHRPTGIAAFVASLLAALSVSAQEAAAPTGFQDQTKLQEIIVTAEKRPERLEDVPVPVTELSAQMLIDNNQLRLQDYYTSVPGLNLMTDEYGAPAVSIRGLTTGGFTNPTVGIVVDDVPYGSSSSHGYGQQLFGVDPTDLASVEVLRGPQGTLYGASTLGGLIKYVTVAPSTEALSGHVGFGVSTVYNGAEPGYNFNAAVNVPVTDTLAVRVSGFTHQDPGYIDDPALGLKGVNEGWVDGAHLAALWQPSQDFSLKLSALVQYNKTNGISEADVEPGLKDLQQDDVPGSGATNRNLQAYSATLKANLGGVTLTSITGYSILRNIQYLDYTNLLSSFSQTNFGVAGSVIYENNPTDKFSEELRFSDTLGQRIDWLVGGFYTHESSHEIEDVFAEDATTGGLDGLGLHDDLPFTYAEYAGFADVTVHAADRFDVQIGGRESQNTQTYIEAFSGPYVPAFFGLPSPVYYPEARSTDNSFTYLVSPQFKISPDLMVYARFSSGYRPGGPNAIPSLEAYLPPTFKPDTTQNYEAGVKGDFFSRALTFDGSIYYIDWKTMQIQVEDPKTGFDYNTNAGSAKSEGVELSMDARPTRTLTIGAWIAWDNAVLTQAFPAASTAYGLSGDRLPFSSKVSGRFSAEQDLPLPNGMMGFIGAAVSYVGDRRGVFTTSSERQDFPAYTQTDLRAGVRDKSWTVNLYVTNIGDERGILNGGLGNSNPAAFEYIQPRTVGLMVSDAF